MPSDPHFLDTPDGRRAVDLARDLLSGTAHDPLRARAALDRALPGLAANDAREAMAQAQLQLRAAARFDSAAELSWTVAGLAEASRQCATRRRAQRLLDAGVEQVADLTGGLGLDAIGFAQAGLTVVAVERDPLVAEHARRNARRLGVDDRLSVITGSCQDEAILGGLATEAWFVDPARRPDHTRIDGSHIRLDDPERWSPPWSWVLAQVGRPRVLLAKTAPGIDHAALATPGGATVEWVSQDGQLLEAAPLWSEAPATPGKHRAVLIDSRGRTVLELDASTVDTSAIPKASAPDTGEVLIDPDPAIVRAGLVRDLAAATGSRMADDHLAYLVAADPLTAQLEHAGRQWRLVHVGPYRKRELADACAAHGIGHVDITGRGRSLDAARVRKDLRLPGGGRRGVVAVFGLGPQRTTLVALGVPTAQPGAPRLDP